jgi:uncharacterized protein YbaP (TraB family)
MDKETQTMKKALFKRTLGLAIALILIAAPAMTVFASEPPDVVQVTDMYSPWAEIGVFMAQSVYGFGHEGTYSNFRGTLVTEKFEPVYESLAEALGSPAELDLEPGASITRGQLFSALCGVLDAEAETEDEAAEHLASEKLISGRVVGGETSYFLDAVCTVEEMIVLSVKVYEYAVRAAGEDSKGFFWEIKGENNTVYLLGSVHYGDNTIYPLSEAIMTAFVSSANLAVEADVFVMDEETMAYMMAAQLVDIEKGESIADYVSEETYELYVMVLDALELTEEYLYLKPWAAALMLQSLLMEADEDSSLLGMDMLLLFQAYSLGKNIIEIEGAVFQIDMFSSFSPELQDFMLLSTLLAIVGPLEDIDEDAEEEAEEEAEDAAEEEASEEEAAEEMTAAEVLAYLIEIIKSGDEEAFSVILAASRDVSDDDPLGQEYDDALWTNRDIGMADVIAGFLKSETNDGDYFVVIGAGHTIGETSVVALLIKMGYEVVRVK